MYLSEGLSWANLTNSFLVGVESELEHLEETLAPRPVLELNLFCRETGALTTLSPCRTIQEGDFLL